MNVGKKVTDKKHEVILIIITILYIIKVLFYYSIVYFENGMYNMHPLILLIRMVFIKKS